LVIDISAGDRKIDNIIFTVYSQFSHDFYLDLGLVSGCPEKGCYEGYWLPVRQVRLNKYRRYLIDRDFFQENIE
jgi:hypothetical protein